MTLSTILYPILIFLGTVYAVSTTSWLFTQVYSAMCAPFTFWGLITMPIKMASPLCHIIHYLQLEASKFYVGYFIAAAASIVTFLTGLLKN